MSVLVFILIALATFRLTRMVTTDVVPFGSMREAFVNRWGIYDDAADKKVAIGGRRTNGFMRKLAYLWECDWCASIWVGGILTLITVQFVSIPLPVLVWLSASAVTGLIAQRQPD